MIKLAVAFSLLVFLASTLVEALPTSSPQKAKLPVVNKQATQQVSFPPERPVSRVFTDRDGLPQNSIQSMAFDKNGYLWIATQSGVAVYNGREWKQPIQALNAKYVNTIVVTSDSSLWFGTNSSGVLVLKDGEYVIYDTTSGLPNNQVNSILETKSSTGQSIMWIGTEEGLLRIEDNALSIYDTKSGLPSNHIFSLFQTTNSNNDTVIWVGTDAGLACFEENRWVDLGKNNITLRYKINCLAELDELDGSQTLWVGTDGGGVAYLRNNKWAVFNTKSGLPNDRILSLLKTSMPNGKPTIWVGTKKGLAKLEQNKWSVCDDELKIPNKQIFSLLVNNAVDGSYTLWIGTNGGGLLQVTQQQWTSLDIQNGLPSKVVLSFLETKLSNGNSVFWVGTLEGLVRFEGDSYTIFNTETGLPDNIILSLLETINSDGSHVLWVGTSGGGLARLQKGQWTVFNTQSGLPHNRVGCLLKTAGADGSTIIWAGTDGGVACLSKEKWNVFNINNGLPSNLITSLLETTAHNKSNILWVGTNGGFAKFENGDWSTVHFSSNLPSCGIFGLLETKESNGDQLLWVGTLGSGVFWTNLTNPSSSWFNLSDKSSPILPSTTVYQIREDIQKRIYLFTNRGIVRLTKNGLSLDLYTFTIEDGLPSNECNDGASMVDSHGRIWVGTTDGCAVFTPAKKVEDKTAKPLHIEKVEVKGKDTVTELVAAGLHTKYQYPYKSLLYYENNVSFEYSLLSYFRESNTVYKTQLIGLDNQPSGWTSDYKRSYTNLPEGEYAFVVWARDYAGNESPPAKYVFRIKPAPWRTWWAYISYVFAGIGSFYIAIKLRLRSLEKEKRLLEEKIEERTIELGEKVDELGYSNKQLDSAREEAERKNAELDIKIIELNQKNKELAEKNDELVSSQKRADLIFSALSEKLPGTVLDKKYKLEFKIGSGGFGAVYKGTHLELDRAVAIKVFRPSAGNDSVKSLHRFRLEGISACKVNHPNAITVMDSGVSDDGIAYIVMELLTGYPLSRELKAKGKISVRRCEEIIAPVCAVLTEAHKSGIIHRDVKPDNIFLHQAKEGEIIKVVDFGIAKLLGEEFTPIANFNEKSITGGIVGTPLYMAPERLRNKPYDGRSDVYSVGVMLYEMLCGQLPFPVGEDGMVGVVMQHLTATPLPLRRHKPDIPEDIEAVVMKALRKDQEKRPTAEEFIAEFSSVALKYPKVPEASIKIEFSHKSEEQLLAEENATTAENAPTKNYESNSAINSQSTTKISKSMSMEASISSNLTKTS